MKIRFVVGAKLLFLAAILGACKNSEESQSAKAIDDRYSQAHEYETSHQYVSSEEMDGAAAAKPEVKSDTEPYSEVVYTVQPKPVVDEAEATAPGSIVVSDASTETLSGIHDAVSDDGALEHKEKDIDTSEDD